jgi:uncharacterized surface protein with fasciclin (FAS1) repeats
MARQERSHSCSTEEKRITLKSLRSLAFSAAHQNPDLSCGFGECPVRRDAENGGRRQGEHMVKTVGDCEFTAMEKDGVIMIKDGQGNIANVAIADVRRSNGVIRMIDKVFHPRRPDY